MSEVEVGSGVRLHHMDTGGDGRPVVLIHGWPLSGKAWQGQVGPLRDAGHRVVAYDRRGFGHSDKPSDGYDYDTLADDLAGLLEKLELSEVTLVGFSMGGGEVARYVSRHGEERLRSVVFAAAVPPYLRRSEDNPDGPLDDATAAELRSGLEEDRDAFFEQFTTQFFSAGGELRVSEEQRQEAVELCRLSDHAAALGCMEAWATTDFRDDLERITVPTLVLHGDADAIVPLEGSGARTHATIPHSELVVVEGAPHGLNVSHAEQFDRALIEFLGR